MKHYPNDVKNMLRVAELINGPFDGAFMEVIPQNDFESAQVKLQMKDGKFAIYDMGQDGHFYYVRTEAYYEDGNIRHRDRRTTRGSD